MDESCTCVERDAILVQSTIDPDATRLQLVIGDDAEARRTIHVRMVELPFAGALFP
jgi:hypothetical protein